jgi:hypothetical protein
MNHRVPAHQREAEAVLSDWERGFPVDDPTALAAFLDKPVAAAITAESGTVYELSLDVRRADGIGGVGSTATHVTWETAGHHSKRSHLRAWRTSEVQTG